MGTHGGKNWGYPGTLTKKGKLDRAAGMQEDGLEMERGGSIGKG